METATITKWNLDPTHSEIGFKVKHMMITNVSGSFGTFNVTAQTKGDDFSTADITFTADINTISTSNADRDTHLKSGDFFDAEKHPELKFVSTRMERKDDDRYKLHGNLTIKGITKPVQLDVEFGGIGKDPWGNEKAGFSLSGKIKRTDWNLNWNAALETGGVLVSEEVKLTAEVQLIKG
ncbi:MAG TPA: YceI family protein [Ohtaekwangia sp.]|nr:YceI family protein [Ohtaekwangia sp.]